MEDKDSPASYRVAQAKNMDLSFLNNPKKNPTELDIAENNISSGKFAIVLAVVLVLFSLWAGFFENAKYAAILVIFSGIAQILVGRKQKKNRFQEAS